MADEKQYRSVAQDRGQERQSTRARGHDVDPLAELARLIGQTDPFSDKRDPRAAPAARPSLRPAPPAPTAPPAQPPRSARPSKQYDYDDAPQPEAYTPPAAQERNRYQAPQRVAYPVTPPAAPTHAPAYAPAPVYDAAPEADAYGHAQYATGYDQQSEAYGADAQYDDPNAEGYYAEPEYAADDASVHPRRSRKLLIGVAVVSVVLLGAAGALGYRTIYGHLQHSGPPPVIKAETTPSKVAPEQSASQQQGKLIYDRIGAANGKDERIVSREEKPVEIKPAGGPAPGAQTAPPPESSLPPGPVTSQVPISTSGGIGAQATPQSPTLGRAPSIGPSGATPRKVHTVTIRPNEPFTPPAPQPPAATPGPRSEMQAPEQTASAGPITPPSSVEKPVQPRQVRTQPIHANNAPLSLTPAANAAPAAAAPEHVASTGSVPVGSYAVQLASHRTEGEAKTAFHRLQGKFPSLLGNRELIIRKADLGAKGIYYRAMVGPFATASEATGFCGNLKSSGGQCVVQRN
ncbi:MAG TPA: SPOR domain-containing protein [Xanthobacteraceae bacterium]|jgi:hypothetical protein|nr:SPOR domain-containing protein [Xanthobacteraceae bacterium]